MNWDRIEGNWKEFKGKARQQWGKLTDDDVEFSWRANGPSSRAGSSNATAWPGMRPSARSTRG
jgi:hypothetical protein